MTNKQLPDVRLSQDEIVNDDILIERDKLPKRMLVALPDLSRSINPKSRELGGILDGLNRFNVNRGGLSESSVRQLASVLRVWDRYCESKGAYSLPITASFALGWFKHELIENKKSIATLEQYRAQLSYLQTWFKDMNNPLNDREIKDFYKSMKKDFVEYNGRSYVQKQAFALRAKDLSFLLKHIDVSNMLNLRDLTLASVAYSTALREGEFSSIRLRDLKIQPDASWVLTRTSSKTSINVKSKAVVGVFASILSLYLSRIRNKLTDESYIFTNITKNGRFINVEKPVSARQINQSFCRLYTFALEQGHTFTSPAPRHWTGHSGRVGAVQDAYKAGMSSAQLMSIGDWSSNLMPQRYIRELDINDSSIVSNQMAASQEIESELI